MFTTWTKDRLLLLSSSLLLLSSSLAGTVFVLESPSTGSLPWYEQPSAAPSTSNQPPAGPTQAAPGTLQPTPGTPVCARNIRYLNLTSAHKQTPASFGDPVKVNAASQYDVINAMRDYAYQDPAGAAVLTAAFDPDADFSKINNRPLNYVEDHHMWCQEVDSMLNTALSAAYRVTGVDTGTPTFGMKKASGTVPVTIFPTTTSAPGTAAVFTFYGHTVKLRLDCHFQPVAVANPPL